MMAVAFRRQISNENFNGSSSPEFYRTKRDMFDLTVLKLHDLNRPTRRDSSLRKSVLIFNLLRCLQKENLCDVAYDDVDMTGNSSISSADHRIMDSNDNSFTDAENIGRMPDEANDFDSSFITEAETRFAVGSLLVDVLEESGDSERASVCYQYSSADGNSWKLASCRTSEPEMMDIDPQPNESPSFPLSTMFIDHGQVRSTGSDLITESYRLLENGSAVANESFGRAAQGEYRPFDKTVGFNLLA